MKKAMGMGEEFTVSSKDKKDEESRVFGDESSDTDGVRDSADDDKRPSFSRRGGRIEDEDSEKPERKSRVRDSIDGSRSNRREGRGIR